MSKQLLLLALTLSAAPAFAGSVPVVALGTVSGNSLTGGPLTGIAPVTPVKMWYQVTTPGFDVAPGQDRSYTMQTATFTLDLGGTQVHFTTTGQPPQLDVVNNFPVADGLFTFAHQINVQSHAMECEMHDSTGTVFHSTDIAQCVGTFPGSAFDTVDWNVLGPGGGISIALGSFTIYPDVSSPIGTNYCTSTTNSSGGAAVISATGCPSVAVGAVTLHGSSMPANKASLFFYGPNPTQSPLGNGFLCVGGGLFRFPAGTTSAAGTIAHAIDFHSSPAGLGGGSILPGSTWRFQGWFRDGAGITNTTDATAIVFAP
jgi:hypothetical protein